MEKKGQIGLGGLIFIIIAIAIVIVAGIFIALGAVALDFVADVAFPEIQSIGMIGDANVTEYYDYSVKPLDTVIQNLTWIGGVVYMVGIIGLLAIAFSFRMTMSRVLIALFLGLAILLIFVSIIMSNVYEDIYNEGGDIGDRLKEHTLLSYLLLESPFIFTIIIFVAGIIMFSGTQEEDYV